MGKIAFAFALCAASAFAEYTYKDFYRVDDWKDPVMTGTAYYVDNYGNVKSWNYNLNPNENGGYSAAISNPGDQDAYSAYWTAVQASIAAAEALAEAKIAQAQTDAFALRLAKLLVTDGFDITDPNGVVRTVRLNAGSLGQALAGSSGKSDPLAARIDTPFSNGDGKTIESTTDKKHLQLVGTATATSSTEGWWDDYGFVVPYLKGNSNLGWKKFGGFDGSVLDRVNSTTAGGARLLTLYGWYRDGGNCTAPLSEMLTKDDATQRGNRQNHFLLAQYTAGQTPQLHYVPIGDLMPGGAPVDGKSVTTNETDGASTQGVASLYGWAGDVEENAETLTQMLSDGSSEGRSKNYVLARVGTGDDAYLAYLPIGQGLDGVTWATNWTEAVEHITKEETIQIVSFVTNSWNHENFVTNIWTHENFITNMWNHENFITNTWNHENFITNTWNHENFITNTWNHETFITNTWNHENFITNIFTHENFVTNTWNHENFITNMWTHENFLTNVVNHENFITNVIDAYSTISNFHEFVTFQTNSYERLHTIENWNYVTNFIVRYLGGMDSGVDGGGGGGEDTGPKIAPEDDPYSEEYVPEKIDNYLLPVKNARNIVAITNEPFAMLDATKMLDFQSINTNKSWLAQIYGFEEAETGTTPVKRSDGEGGYKLEWVEHPAELLAITTNGIAEIRQWMVKNNVTNIFTSVVSNSEAVATMRTNFFAHVQADKLLDNESVWTNGTRRVEIKGYGTAPLHTVPYIDYRSADYDAGRSRALYWELLPFADTEANGKYGNVSVPSTIDAELYSAVDDQGEDVKCLTLHGFAEAEAGQVPVKRALNNANFGIEWEYPMVGDEKSLTTNYNHGAVSDGKLSIRGYRTATAGQFLARTADGVAWTNSAAALDVDGKSVTTNESSKISLYGFDGAAANAIPHKENGVLVWGGISAVTNTILAGAGINITDNGGGAITISAQAMTQESGGEVTVSVVTDARYDPATHKFQVKRRQLVFTGSLGPESAWTDVFETVSHQSEHEIEEH